MSSRLHGLCKNLPRPPESLKTGILLDLSPSFQPLSPLAMSSCCFNRMIHCATPLGLRKSRCSRSDRNKGRSQLYVDVIETTRQRRRHPLDCPAQMNLGRFHCLRLLRDGSSHRVRQISHPTGRSVLTSRTLKLRPHHNNY